VYASNANVIETRSPTNVIKMKTCDKELNEVPAGNTFVSRGIRTHVILSKLQQL